MNYVPDNECHLAIMLNAMIIKMKWSVNLYKRRLKHPFCLSISFTDMLRSMQDKALLLMRGAQSANK